IMGIEQIGFPNSAHNAQYYKVAGAAFPFVLLAVARAARLKWAATAAATAYLAISLVMIWVLQLFPATPKLAPVFNPVTHMVGPLEPCRPLALPLLADRSGPRDGERAWMGRGVCDRVRARRAVVGELDGASPAVKGSVARLSAIAGIALVASAHVGSPDTHLE